MCEPKTSSIPSVGDVAGGLPDLVYAIAKVAWRPFFVLLGIAFVVTHLWWLLGITAGVTLGTWAAMRVLHRHVVIQAPSSLRQRATLSAPQPVRAVAPPRNLAITVPRRALPAPAPAVHLHFHGVPAEDIAAIVRRQGSPARPAIEKE